LNQLAANFELAVVIFVVSFIAEIDLLDGFQKCAGENLPPISFGGLAPILKSETAYMPGRFTARPSR
jgi:hypothetical protein